MDNPGQDLSIIANENVFDVEEIMLHPDYNPYVDFKINDVAVLRLAQPVNSTIAKPVSKIYSLETIEANNVAYAWSAGWGSTSTSGICSVNYDLHKINVEM